MRGATRRSVSSSICARISIHAPHARSDAHPDCPADVFFISIHAPHARSDDELDAALQALLISIHAPHARSDADLLKLRAEETKFQSTLLMRGATTSTRIFRMLAYFNPRSSCEERLRGVARHEGGRDFNPRSSCEERQPMLLLTS